MDKAKDDAYFEAKIKKDLAFAIDAIGDLSAEEFNENELVSDAICFRFIQISEEASGLSESYVSSHREVPWKKMRGLRNRIVHDYGRVDLTVVYQTVKNDFPILLSILE